MRASAATYEASADVYARFGNASLAGVVRRMLPPGGSVLDIGCAGGGLLEACADLADRRVGFELSPTAAERARAHADEVVVGDLLGLEHEETFDVVVAADVIEHLPDPDAGLQRLQRWLRPDGAVVISVPNIAHWTARLRLLGGRWQYEDSGIFDAGHLRFFTRSTLLDAVRASGLEVEAVVPVLPALRNFLPRGRIGRRLAERLEPVWSWLSRRRPTLFAYQWIVVARPGPTP